MTWDGLVQSTGIPGISDLNEGLKGGPHVGCRLKFHNFVGCQ